MIESGGFPPFLEGRVAVVFGATGWIGSAICRTLVDAGASLAMVGRDPDRLDVLQRELKAGDRVMSLTAEVTSQLEVDDVRASAIARFGHVDLLVVSSGVITGSAFEDGVPADWAEMIDVNLRGLLNVSQTFAEPLLESAERGAPADMVLIGSVSTDVRTPRFAVFNAVSASIKQLARTLRNEYGPRGIRVHIVEPAFDAGPIAGGIIDDREHDPLSARAVSPVKPEAIAAVVALSAALPSSANLAEVLLLPTDPR
jgi:NADP-dependent 3-hydroxy acid dehydrogenase YdfG